MEEIHKRNIFPIELPACSPDLNQIESVWNNKKNRFIQVNFPCMDLGKYRPLNKLHRIVKEAWDSVSSEQLLQLIENMSARCQSMIDAKGVATK